MNSPWLSKAQKFRYIAFVACMGKLAAMGSCIPDFGAPEAKSSYGGWSTLTQGNLRCSYNFGRNGILRMSMKHDYVSQSCFLHKKLNKLFSSKGLHNQNKDSRFVLVRSELAGSAHASLAFPHSDVKLSSRIRGICFYAIAAVSAMFLIVLMVVAHPFVLLRDPYRRKAHHLVAKLWAILTVSLFLKIEFKGLEKLPPEDTPAVYVSNHQSFLDIYTLLTLGRSFKFISKTGIFVFPIIGWAMSVMGVIPLRRLDSRSQLECLKRCMDLIKKGGSVFFFPEGTRSKDGKVGAFKKGAFSVAVKTRVPVVPVTIMGTGDIMPVGMEHIVNPGAVKVVFHEPIRGSDAEVICNEARNRIADEFDRQR